MRHAPMLGIGVTFALDTIIKTYVIINNVSKKKLKRISLKKRTTSKNALYLKIALVIFLLLTVGVVVKVMISSENYHVLGTSTFLAKGGSDDSGGDDGSGSNSGSGSSGNSNFNSKDSGSGSSGGSNGNASSGSNTSAGSGSGNNGISQSSSGVSVSDNTKVMCTGPDGKKFETRAKDCEELNKAWNKPANFTVINNQQKILKTETRTRSTSPSPVTSISPSINNTPELENDDSGIRTKTETKPNEERTEVRLSETERIRTRTKDGRTRIDITSGGIKTRLEFRDGRVIVKAEQEDGTEVELEDDTLLKIDDRLAADNIKVATAGAEKFLVQKGDTGAVTDFPISVDLATNEVFVTTPTGQKTITVLPEQAIQNLIAANIVNRLGGQAIANEALNNNLTSVSQLITLGEKNGIPVYEINGISDQKLLGFIPVKVEKDLTVSAETGNVLSTNISFGSRILDVLSF